jgi:hypothetical protein
LRNNGEEYKYCCAIYATAPFIQEKYLSKGLKILKDNYKNGF